MIDGKGPPEVRRVNRVEIVLTLFYIMGEIMDFRVCGFSVQVLEQQEHPLGFRRADRPLETLQACRLTLGHIAGAMIAGMDLDPARIEGFGDIDRGAHIVIGSLRQVGRVLRNIDSRERISTVPARFLELSFIEVQRRQ